MTGDPLEPEPPRVLVTRAADDAAALGQALAEAGFLPVVVPLLDRQWRVEAVADAAVANPEADWVVITSATAAQVVAAGAPNAWRSARWAAVGPATADRLLAFGTAAHRVPDRATAADLIAALGDLSGQTVIYPRADLAPPTTAAGLRAAGATVVDVVAYDNVVPAGVALQLARVMPVAATTLLSGSAAERIAEAVGSSARRGLGKIVVIGPSTARTCRGLGLPVDAMADPHTVAGVVAAVRTALSRT